METAELIRRCAYVSSKLAALPNTSMILGRRRRLQMAEEAEAGIRKLEEEGRRIEH